MQFRQNTAKYSDDVPLRTMPTNKEVYFLWFMTMQGKQILPRAIQNTKRKLGVTAHFFRDKIQSTLWRFIPN